MKANDTVDFSTVDWADVDEKKASFIYNEALDNYRGTIENINVINNKAMGMISFTMPLVAALAGFFAVTWGNASLPLFAAALCAASFLFIVLVLLLLILAPKGVLPGAASPAAYFTADFYRGDMRHMLIGCIVTIQKAIDHNKKVMHRRGGVFRWAVILCAAFPAASLIVFLVCHFVLN